MDTIRLMDIHTHLLPKVDDGASDMEETVRMLEMAKGQGIRTIIATPHFGLGSLDKSVEELIECKEKVQQKAAAIDPDIKIYLGNELYYRESVLAGSRYVLIEFSVRVDYKSLYQGLNKFILAGYAPILAHVERYRCLMEEEVRIDEIRELGVYIQMNGSSLLGNFLDKRVRLHRRLLKERLLHFVATDCHNTSTRAPNLEKAFHIVVKLTDWEYAVELFYDNPLKIIENKYI
jgi:protein-tyrosine phosphatase